MAKILIVDDAAFTRKLIAEMVKSGGHEVVGCAEDGEQGLELFDKLHPELVILDYLMPGKDGEAVLKEMIQQDPSARVIMVSASGDHAYEQRALQAGAKAFMVKPWTKKDLLKVIDQTIEN